MLTPVLSSKFKKDVQRMQKRGKDTAKLKKLMELLIDQQPLPARYKDHPLKGDWVGFRDAHIEPNWLLLYMLQPESGEVYFQRTGTHSDLFDE